MWKHFFLIKFSALLLWFLFLFWWVACLLLSIFIHYDPTIPTSSSTCFTITNVSLLCLETLLKQTLMANRRARVNHKEKGYTKGEIYSHLWYQQTGTPGRHHHTQHHAASKISPPAHGSYSISRFAFVCNF